MADGSPVGRVLPNRRVVSRKVNAVSFFSGCGGLDLGFIGGFEYLGKEFARTCFDVVAAYDADVQAVEAYKSNINENAVVTDLSTADVKAMVSADVLLGGFPCQEFSQCGPRGGIESERGKLYSAMVAYAQHHRPKLVVGENVAGLMYRDRGAALRKICGDFEALGYKAHVWEVHAHHFGVPQARHRLFLIFVRDDLDSSGLSAPASMQKQITAKEAISDLLRPSMRYTANQSQYFRAAKAGRGHGQGDEKTPADGPGYTVRANSRSRVQFHYSRPRRLTVRECARLQSFPDSFVFPFTATANMRLIGNAVPPVLAHVIARQLQEFFFQ